MSKRHRERVRRAWTIGVVVGDASAPHTVTVYEDFQCPICHEFEGRAGDRLRKAVDAGRIRLDYRMVAFLDDASTTDYSTRALNAAAVVLDTSGRDVFLEFHDLLFEHQPPEGSAGLSDAQLVRYAVRAGADESAVRPGIEDLTFRQWTITGALARKRKPTRATTWAGVARACSPCG